MRNGIKIIALLAFALVAAAMQGKAQNPNPSWHVGLCPTYANQQGCSNVGLQAIVGKTLGDLWGWRLSASVNGLVPYSPAASGTPSPRGKDSPDGGRTFDRYATAMTGPVLNLKPLYAFVQVGAACNPSSTRKIGIAANTGAGVAFDIGKRSRIFAEAAVDVVPTGKATCSTVSAGIGYAVRF